MQVYWVAAGCAVACSGLDVVVAERVDVRSYSAAEHVVAGSGFVAAGHAVACSGLDVAADRDVAAERVVVRSCFVAASPAVALFGSCFAVSDLYALAEVLAGRWSICSFPPTTPH